MCVVFLDLLHKLIADDQVVIVKVGSEAVEVWTCSCYHGRKPQMLDSGPAVVFLIAVVLVKCA